LAHKKLDEVDKQARNHTKDWLSKVRVVPPTQPLLPPSIDQDIQAAIYQALLENRQINAVYLPFSSDAPKDFVLHPLGLIMRGAISYLVACAWNYDDVRLYAIHRFHSVAILDDEIQRPDNFSLDKALATGLADFASQGTPQRLVLRCSEELAAYLAETPLSLDQEMDPIADGWIRVYATVNDTWQLRWWLLGQGAAVEVCSPEGIRDEIRTVLHNAARPYMQIC
jgi:predicted DNA-binding transcriptional regulator YafY